MSEPTNEQRLAAIPKYTHEYYEEEATQRIIMSTAGYHFTKDQVERIIARLRLVQIVERPDVS